MSEWHAISSQQEVDDFLRLFGYFHDGCIREIRLWTETFVNPDLTMTCPCPRDSHIRVHFQRQFAEPSAIEMQFDEVFEVRLCPSPESYDSVIFEAVIFIDKGVFYWVEGGGGDITALKGATTWIAGKKLKWRDVSAFMGNQLRYGSESDRIEA